MELIADKPDIRFCAGGCDKREVDSIGAVMEDVSDA